MAIDFNGTDEYLDSNFNPNTEIGASQAFSVACLVTGYTSDGFVWGCYSTSGDPRFYLRTEDGDEIRFGCGNETGVTTTDVYDKDIWNTVVCTFDGASSCKAYINGNLVKSFSGSDNLPNLDMYIGCENNSGSAAFFFEGAVAYLKVWKRELSAEEALLLHLQSGADTLVDNLSLFLDLIGSGTLANSDTIIDITGNYNATVVNTPSYTEAPQKTTKG